MDLFLLPLGLLIAIGLDAAMHTHATHVQTVRGENGLNIQFCPHVSPTRRGYLSMLSDVTPDLPNIAMFEMTVIMLTECIV